MEISFETAQKITEKKDCCKQEDMKPYRGQKGQVSRATHFCTVCGQHWVFVKAVQSGEQEWFSATPATPALEEKETGPESEPEKFCPCGIR